MAIRFSFLSHFAGPSQIRGGRHCCVAGVLVLAAAAALAEQDRPLALMPVPRTATQQACSFPLQDSSTMQVLAPAGDSLAWTAANRWLQQAKKTTGIAFMQKTVTPASSAAPAAITLQVRAMAPFTIGMDESYTLTVAAGGVHIEAANSVAELRALATLRQLLASSSGTYTLPCVTITDAPRFPWRGLMIDVSRHFLPIETLRLNIDAMEAVKLNVLHLHLSDNEGFRLESKALPKLQLLGSDGEYYTRDEMRELIAYAAERGILIVPEFDLPGHSQSWLSAYPELSSSPEPLTPGSPSFGTITSTTDIATIMKQFQNAHLPAFDPTKEETYIFLDHFVSEMSALFPGPYIHIGADENNGVVWRNNPRIAKYMQDHHYADTRALQAYFVGRLQKIVEAHGKKTVAWEEAFDPATSHKSIFQVWSTQPTTDLLKTPIGDNQLLISKGFYLDYFFPASVHYLNESMAATASPQAIPPVMGGEAAMWSEVEDRWNIDTRIWPRAAAIAERLWSPASVTDVNDMYRRLFLLDAQLDQVGVDNVSAYQRQLRRLSAQLPTAPVQTLIDVLAPVEGFSRLLGRLPLADYQRNSFAPLNQVQDIALIDSYVKYDFGAAVKAWKNNHKADTTLKLRFYLEQWAGNDAALKPYFAASPELREIATQSAHLASLAGVGLRLLNARSAGDRPTQMECEQALTAAQQAVVGTKISILPEMKELLQAPPSQ